MVHRYNYFSRNLYIFLDDMADDLMADKESGEMILLITCVILVIAVVLVIAACIKYLMS